MCYTKTKTEDVDMDNYLDKIVKAMDADAAFDPEDGTGIILKVIEDRVAIFDADDNEVGHMPEVSSAEDVALWNKGYKTGFLVGISFGKKVGIKLAKRAIHPPKD